jgi:SAM-dependent methyltransferase
VTAFDLYSAYYDLLYQDKDYGAEAGYLVSLIQKHHPAAKSLLDLGCGTGKHAALLKRHGLEVCGVDLSQTMLDKARQNHPDIPFHAGDARQVRLGQSFDVVTSLFHVASYQTSNLDFESYLATAKAHLNPGGLFIFDFWYGPGVLSDRPLVRVKRMQNDQIKVTRIAEPTLNSLTNVVDVHFQVHIEDCRSGERRDIVENHPMRYFFMPEVKYFLQHGGMELEDVVGWMETTPPGATSWYACAIVRNRAA